MQLLGDRDEVDELPQFHLQGLCGPLFEWRPLGVMDMVSTDRFLAFAAMSLLVIVIPGPSVLFVIGRALAHGRRAGGDDRAGQCRRLVSAGGRGRLGDQLAGSAR